MTISRSTFLRMRNISNKFFITKPTRCTNFSNLFWDESLHVSDSSSVHHQAFFTVHTAVVYVIQVCWQLVSRNICSCSCTGWDSVVHIVRRLQAEWFSFESWQRPEIFVFFLRCQERLWDPHSLLFNGNWGKVADVWSSSLTYISVKVNNEWCYTMTPPVCLLGVYRDNVTFFLIIKPTRCIN